MVWSKRFLGLFMLCLMAGQAAYAQSPEETVRWIYQSMAQPGSGQMRGLGYLSSPEQRAHFFSRRFVQFLAANDSHGGDPATACITYGLEIPGNDFDGAEILRTLSLSSETLEAGTSVTATFSTFGTPARVIYDFIVEDGFWKIDDIAGPGYRVSLIPCTPKAAVTAGAGASSYCYKARDDSLWLDLAPDGSAAFRFDSWQANGHHCGAQGRAVPIAGGWAYDENVAGTACHLEILLTRDQGLELTDRDGLCRQSMCGARAGINGLTFPRSGQVDCASLPRPQY